MAEELLKGLVKDLTSVFLCYLTLAKSHLILDLVVSLANREVDSGSSVVLLRNVQF